jgi:glycosyltransferase involved in cell wall biosynthesis
VIPNAVDANAFDPDMRVDTDLKTRLGLHGSSVIGFIGSFYAYEGLDLLLRSFPAMLAQRPDLRVLLVGGGPQEEALKRLARELHIADRVVFSGRVAHQEVQRYYSIVDVFIYPRISIRLTELVTPLKPLEAMAQSRLVVASDVGGHRELIHDGETGVLFKAGNGASLAESVIRIFDNPDAFQTVRKAGRKFVEQRRTWEISTAGYLPVFETLCRGKAKNAYAG